MEIFINNTGSYKTDQLISKIFDQMSSVIPFSCVQIFESQFDKDLYYETFGEDAFLDKTNLKYPVVNPKTEKYDATLLCVAMVNAYKNGHKNIIENVKDIYDEYIDKSKDNITLTVKYNNQSQTYDLYEYLILFI